MKHTDRITIGSDAWAHVQWNNYKTLISFARMWLFLLKDDVDRQIAFEMGLILT